MTLEEKLDHFYTSVIENATKQNIEIVDEYKKILQKNFDERKEAALRKAESNYRIAEGNILRERNRQLSARSMEIRRKSLEKNAEFSEKIFIQVMQKLEDYMKTPEYESFLCNQIKKASDFAKGDAITVYLNPSDTQKIPALEKKTGVALKTSDRDFIGGCRAVIPSRSILIDNSFLTKLEEAKSTFKL